MIIRKYKSYDDYIKHQKTKTLLPNVKNVSNKKFNKRVSKFTELFGDLSKYIGKKSTAICLGARRGEEIVALQKLGYIAMGIDLVPCSPLVIEGDFHNLPFEDSVFDLAFSNAVDHVFEVDKFCSEISRVVKPNGYIMFHLILDKWSDEMSLGMGKSADIFSYFKDQFDSVDDRDMEPYGGGLNHILIMKKHSK